MEKTDCTETIELVFNGWFATSRYLKLFLAPCSLLLNTTLILALLKCSSVKLHQNLRCLLFNLSLSCLMASGLLFFKTFHVEVIKLALSLSTIFML